MKPNKLILIFLVFVGIIAFSLIIIKEFGKNGLLLNIPGKTQIPEVQDSTLSFEPLDINLNQSSYLTEKEVHLITSENQWDEFLQKVRTPFPENIKKVDFTREMMVIVAKHYMGGGNSLKITKLEEKEGKLNIYVKEVLPGEGCRVTKATVINYHMIRAKKSTLAPNLVVETEIKDCAR